MTNDHANQTIGSNWSENAFASLLLRDGLLQNLLTDDYATITYWAGKELARQFPLESITEVSEFFETAAFGQVEIIYQSESEQQWVLSGPVVADRLKLNRQADFSLETGFLAQQVELQNEAVSEGYFQVITRKNAVTITIMVDNEHKIHSLTAAEQVSLRDAYFDTMADKNEKSQDVVEQAAEAPQTTTFVDKKINNPDIAETNETTVIEDSEVDEPVADNHSYIEEVETPSLDEDHQALESEEEELSVEQSITNSLLAFDPKLRKNRDSTSSIDF